MSRSLLRPFLILLVPCLLVLAQACHCAVEDSGKGGPIPAHNFRLESIEGGEVQLSDFSGKVVVLNFWATWCPPCRIEIPELIHLYSRYRSRNLVVIGIAMDPVGPDALKTFAGEMGINFPVLMGDDTVSQGYGGIIGIPSTFVIDQQGMIQNRHVGLIGGAALEREILPFLGD